LPLFETTETRKLFAVQPNTTTPNAVFVSQQLLVFDIYSEHLFSAVLTNTAHSRYGDGVLYTGDTDAGDPV